MDFENIKITEILIFILGTISTYLLWRVRHQKDKIKDIENQLSVQKYNLYSSIIHLLFDITASGKITKKISERDLVKRLLEIKKDMFVYAPDDVFRQYSKWTLEITKDSKSLDHMTLYYELLKLIRKDMGHRYTKLSFDEFMIFFFQSEAAYLDFQEENNF
ncbi:hypothetical protein A9Q93_00575 [Nonlabens dokdonensis]|uniref:DUF4760 domain-containing protein n=1 Tax=Nonlabens dokdonensis TaxID=328515 RepID=A0A1Z8BG56_9FLAO|nr:hypothetical protein [Nonlabens dokdonensis]OUS21549.1 hypothetical protein A9Q93_00575 [Nonlabens dokdonensis]